MCVPAGGPELSGRIRASVFGEGSVRPDGNPVVLVRAAKGTRHLQYRRSDAETTKHRDNERPKLTPAGRTPPTVTAHVLEIDRE